MKGSHGSCDNLGFLFCHNYVNISLIRKIWPTKTYASNIWKCFVDFTKMNKIPHNTCSNISKFHHFISFCNRKHKNKFYEITHLLLWILSSLQMRSYYLRNVQIWLSIHNSSKVKSYQFVIGKVEYVNAVSNSCEFYCCVVTSSRFTKMTQFVLKWFV